MSNDRVRLIEGQRTGYLVIRGHEYWWAGRGTEGAWPGWGHWVRGTCKVTKKADGHGRMAWVRGMACERQGACPRDLVGGSRAEG